MGKASFDAFRTVVHNYYLSHGRYDLPWRQPEPDGTFNPYKILVSEIMLQQTQVDRVVPKFNLFMAQFPNLEVLAAAPLSQVLTAWQGLGYNRRAKYVWHASQLLACNFNGVVPQERSRLQKLDGVGYHTAGAIMVYAFDKPVVFIETNVRTVFIHHFFKDQTGVSDEVIGEQVKATLDYRNPREWYWSLMDYGTQLKRTVGNLSRVSKTYHVQSRFVGSSRQLRGQVVRLLARGPMSRQALFSRLADSRSVTVVRKLENEGMIRYRNGSYKLP